MLKSSVKTCLLISSSCVKNREKSLRHVATEAKFSISTNLVLAQIWQFLIAELFEYSPMHVVLISGTKQLVGHSPL